MPDSRNGRGCTAQACTVGTSDFQERFQHVGCLLAVDPDWRSVRLVSANVGTFFGRSTDAVLDRPPERILGQALIRTLRARPERLPPDGVLPRCLAITADQPRLNITLHHRAPGVVLEIEPAPPWPDDASAIAWSWAAQLGRAEQTTLPGLLQQACRHLTGHHQCTAYPWEHGVPCPAPNPDFPWAKPPGLDCALRDAAPLHMVVDAQGAQVPLRGAQPTPLAGLTLRAPSTAQIACLRRHGLRSTLALTLYEQDTPWARVLCCSPEPRYVPPHRRQLFYLIAQTAAQRYRLLHERDAALRARRALAMRNARLKRWAHTDALTLVANRHRIEQCLDAALSDCNEEASACSVLLLDIDRFKQINDRYGHDIGDTVLRRIAQEIQRHLRRGDLLGRWGGEEFLAIVPDCTLPQAARLARRLCRQIAALDIPPVGRVTLSIGVAARSPGDTPRRLVRRADQAMYRAKRAGRNCVRLAASPSQATAGD